MKVTTFFKVNMFRMKLHTSSVQKPASGCEINTRSIHFSQLQHDNIFIYSSLFLNHVHVKIILCLSLSNYVLHS